MTPFVIADRTASAIALGAGAACLAALPAVGYVRRMVVEEAELTEGPGGAYGTYAQGRPRLIRGIW